MALDIGGRLLLEVEQLARRLGITPEQAATELLQFALDANHSPTARPAAEVRALPKR